MPHAHTDNSFTMKIIFEEKLATKNDEETNNNVYATLITSLLIQKSVSMMVQKSIHHRWRKDHKGWAWRFTVADDLKESSKITSSKESQITKTIAEVQRVHWVKNQSCELQRSESYWTQRNEDKKELPRSRTSYHHQRNSRFTWFLRRPRLGGDC